MKVRSFDGTLINYEVYGDGIPIILVMGMGGSLYDWPPYLVDFLSKTHKVIIFDNRGAGLSDKPDFPYTMEMYTKDIISIMDATSLKKAHLFGISMGGSIVMDFSFRHEDRLISAGFGCSTFGGKYCVPANREKIEELLDMSSKSEEEIFRIKCETLFTREFIEKNQKLLREWFLRIKPYMPPEFAVKNQFHSLFTLKGAYYKLAELSVPAICVTGKQDKIVPYKNSELICKRVKRCKLIIYEDAGHGFVWEKMEQFASDYLAFILEVENG